MPLEQEQDPLKKKILVPPQRPPVSLTDYAQQKLAIPPAQPLPPPPPPPLQNNVPEPSQPTYEKTPEVKTDTKPISMVSYAQKQLGINSQETPEKKQPDQQTPSASQSSQIRADLDKWKQPQDQQFLENMNRPILPLAEGAKKDVEYAKSILKKAGVSDRYIDSDAANAVSGAYEKVGEHLGSFTTPSMISAVGVTGGLSYAFPSLAPWIGAGFRTLMTTQAIKSVEPLAKSVQDYRQETDPEKRKEKVKEIGAGVADVGVPALMGLYEMPSKLGEVAKDVSSQFEFGRERARMRLAETERAQQSTPKLPTSTSKDIVLNPEDGVYQMPTPPNPNTLKTQADLAQKAKLTDQELASFLEKNPKASGEKLRSIANDVSMGRLPEAEGIAAIQKAVRQPEAPSVLYQNEKVGVSKDLPELPLVEKGVDRQTMTPEQFKSDLVEKFKLPEDQAQAVAAIADARASTWAKATGKTPEEWYASRLAAVERGGEPGPLKQEDSPILKKAIEKFGVTNDIREGGYLTPDGKMLDFTGRHEAVGYENGVPTKGKQDYLKGQRSLDHRKVAEFYEGMDSATDAMHRFMGDTQSARISYIGGDLNIDLASPITESQLKAIKPYIGMGSITVDVTDPATGKTLFYESVDSPTQKKAIELLRKSNELLKGKKDELFQKEEAPVFYSQLQRTIEEKMPNKASPEQIRGLLRDKVKQEEIEWSGLNDFLSDKKSVTKQELLDHIKNNEVQVQEVVKGPGQEGGSAKFTEHQLPGGEPGSYRELLLTMPSENSFDPSKVEIIRDRRSTTQGNVTLKYNGKDLGTYSDDGGVETNWMKPESELIGFARKLWESGNATNPPASGNFRSSHFDEPNILAHVRFNERTIDGKKTLFIEEIQSDWHQKGRKEGYKSDTSLIEKEQEAYEKTLAKKYGTEAWRLRANASEKAHWDELSQKIRDGENGVQNAPFKKTWPDLAFKRVLRYAADNGYEKVAWTTGAQQAARYDLSKQIGEMAYWKDGEEIGISALDTNGKMIDSLNQKYVNKKDLADVVGKDIANKILKDDGDSKSKMGFNDEPGVKYLRGPDLKVGGEGMRGFYDKIIPDMANKYVKKFGGKVGESTLEKPNDQIKYEGPEYTLDELKEAQKIAAGYKDTYISPLTGEKQEYVVNRTAVENPLRYIIKDMEAGVPFQDAVGRHVNGDLLDVMGGKIVPISSFDKVHSIDIPQELSESVKKGQPLFQKGGDVKGSVEFLEDGKAIIKAFEKADVSTAVHELGHVFRRDVEGTDLEAIEKWAGVKEGKWETEHEEKFARGFEKYLKDGKAPNSTLQRVFEQFKQWLTEIYSKIRGLNVKVSPEVKSVFDNLLGKEKDHIPDIEQMVGEPRGTIPDMKERGFVETVREAPRSSPEMSEGVKGEYQPITNAQTVKDARDAITRDQAGVEEDIFGDSPANANSVSAAQLLMEDYQKAGNYDKAIRIAEAISKKLTTQGQSIQAASLWNRLSPTGIVKLADKILRKAGKKLTPEMAKDLSGQSEAIQAMQRKIDELKAQLEDLKKQPPSPDVSSEIADIEKVTQGLEDEKVRSTQKMLRTISDEVPSSLLRKIDTIQTMGQLLNPKTLGRNILGNFIFGSIDNFSQTLSAGIDSLVGLGTGRRTITTPDVSAQLKGMKKGLVEGARDIRSGTDTSGLATQFDLSIPGQSGPTGMPKGYTFENKLGRLGEKALGYALQVPDRAFSTGAMLGDIANQVKLARINKTDFNPEEALTHAKELAKYRTFQDDTDWSKVFTAIKKGLNVGREFGIGSLVMKYPKTPANLMARGVDYSPVSFYRTLKEAVKPSFQKGWDKYTGKAKTENYQKPKFDQEAFVKHLGKALTGSAIIATGYYLAQSGLITGRAVEDKDMAAIRSDEGVGPYRVNMTGIKRFLETGKPQPLQKGDELVSFDWAQPTAIALAIGANMAQADQEGLDRAGQIAETVKGGVDTLYQQPLISGTTKVLRRGSFVDAAEATMEGAMASFVPTIVNQMRQYGDNTARDPYDPSFWKRSVNQVKGKIPVLAAQLPPRRTLWGDVKEQYKDGGNTLLNVFLNPAFVSKYNPSDESSLVLDLFKSTGETKHAPSLPQRKIRYEGFVVEPDGKTLSDMQAYAGQRYREMYRSFIASDRFAALPDTEKADLLSKSVSQIARETKIKFFGDKFTKMAEEKGDEHTKLKVRQDIVDLKETEQADKLYDSLIIMKPEEANNYMQSLMETNPALADKITGLRADQIYRNIMMLPPEQRQEAADKIPDGIEARVLKIKKEEDMKYGPKMFKGIKPRFVAEYLIEKGKDFKTNEERVKWLEDMESKGLVNDNVKLWYNILKKKAPINDLYQDPLSGE